MKRKKRKCISTLLFQKGERHLDQMIDLVCHEKLSYKEKKKNLTIFLIAEWPVFLISYLMNYLQTPPKAIYTPSTLGQCSRWGHAHLWDPSLNFIFSLHLFCGSNGVLHLREEWRSSPHTSTPLWSQCNGWSEFLQGCQLFNLWK